jgi:DNA/RNA-binding domain of Phe-tRNA-synthetase-like protein
VARGDEPFDTVRDGAAVVEHPEAGEIVWRDDDGVTCRRWNWRQCKRTALHQGSRNL